MRPSSIIVEYRPLLQVCQFFVKSSFYQDAQVEVDNNLIRVSSHESILEIVMPDGIQLLENSVSGISANDNSLLFRTQTKPPKNKGSFKTEIYNINDKKTKIEIYKPDLNIEQETHVFCACCSDQLTRDKISFKKILPLPENFDTGDFFCHGKMDVDLDPKKEDLFYGSYYCNIESSLISGDTTIPDLIVCTKCFSWLGNVQDKYVQLWNSTTYFSLEPYKKQDSALKDFLNLIKKSTNEFMSNNKLVIQCNTGKNQIHYLLLWIMGKLSLLTTDELLPTELGKVTLKEKQVTKLLYSYQTSRTELVDKWFDLTNTNGVKMSRNMLDIGVQHLKEMSMQIPEDFRTSQNMNISFLDIPD